MSVAPNMKSINEDCVECYFFAIETETDDSFWHNLSLVVNNYIEELSAEYLWHRDKFKVVCPIMENNSDELPAMLISSTCFGDNIEDEWFIVYLVFKLTKKIENLIAHIVDSDGDFILIEAADALPTWMNPESTENRVFIFNGRIHIVPPHIAELGERLTLKESVSKLINNLNETRVSSDIESIVMNRINCYPRKISENIHKALVKVPIELATVLSLEPNLISMIVNSYCNYDPIDAKCCKNLDFENLVTVTVSFTKCLYAMLTHSKVMKTKSNISVNNKDKSFILGYKLYCGYKIISNELADVTETKDFRKFLENLKNNGFFKDNIEGSKDYKSLKEKAYEYYMTMMCPLNKNVSRTIQELKNTEKFYNKKEELLNNDNEELNIEDSDEWLKIEPENLNKLLQDRYGKKQQFEKQNISPDTVTQKLNSFLNQVSDFEGIEVNDENNTNEIDFDPDIFAKKVEYMLNIITSGPETYSNEIDDSDSYSDYDESASISSDMASTQLKQELTESLSCDILKDEGTSTYNNIRQSLKEEQQYSGPSSNILRNLGFNKMDILDSDDDIE